MAPRVAIAGSGAAGLACAVTLAEHADCVVYERLPVAGGEEWEHPEVAQLARQATALGVRFALGTQALRWDGCTLLAVGQEGGKTDAQALVIATGHRPMTRAELGLEGPRCAGILPVTVALHLLHHGVQPGHAPIIVGGGEWASAAVQGLRNVGVERVIVLDPSSGARPVRVTGGRRISGVEVRLPDGSLEVRSCDALILAHGRVPYRNVDGAVSAAPGVVFAQPGGHGGHESSAAAGRAAAAEAIDAARQPHERQTPALRIGGSR